MILAIDPGKDQGWAYGAIKRSPQSLKDCGLGDPPKAVEDYATVVIVECPWIRPSAADPNDMIVLARKVGRLEERYGRVHLVFPHEWKGNANKEITEAKVWHELSPPERDVLRGSLGRLPAGKYHNVIDAVGLLLFAQRNLHEI